MQEILTIDPILQKYNELKEYFNDKLPNPYHEPIQFTYYIKLYQFYKAREKGS